MTQYSTLIGKFSNSQLSKLESEIKVNTEVTLKISSNVIGDSITNTQFQRFKKFSWNVIRHSRCQFIGKTHLEQVEEQQKQVKDEVQLKYVKIFNHPHPLNNFEKQKYYQNEPIFNGGYSRNNLPKLKDRTYVINLDEYKSIDRNSLESFIC